MISMLRHRFSQFFNRSLPHNAFEAIAASRQATQSALIWQDTDIAVLLFNEEHKQALQIEIAGRSGTFQSWLMGFDLTQNQLLIDCLFPAPPVELMAQQPNFKITLTRHQEVLQLWVCIREKLMADNKPALVVDILAKDYRHDRRLSPRISFERSRGPLCKLQVPMQPQLRGTLVNLSSGGCLLNIFGKHSFQPETCQQLLRASIQVNEEFNLDCQLKIKAIQYFRVPCQHTQLRLQFLGLTLEQQQRLEHCVNAMMVPQWPIQNAQQGQSLNQLLKTLPAKRL